MRELPLNLDRRNSAPSIPGFNTAPYMITWLQNFFLKHNKWLFGGLLVVIIVTFVLTIGPQSFFGSGGSQQRSSLKYYGYDLSSPADQQAMAYTAEVSAILHPEMQVRRDQIMDYAYMRTAALGIADQLGVPKPTKEALTDYVATLTIFMDPQSGEFSAETYNRMLEAIQSSTRYDRESVARVIREDYRITQVQEALGGPSYFLPFEVQKDFLDRQTTYDVAVATLDYNSFSPEIEPTEEELEQFFKENPTRYRIPETISVRALVFADEAYLDEVSDPEETQLESYFEARREQYRPETEPTSEDGETEAEEPAFTLADVREEVLSDWKLEQARRIAAKKSEQFSLRLWQDGILLDTENFNNLIGEFEIQIMEIPAYARDQAPQIEAIPAELLNSMWIYTSNPNRYFSDIAQTGNGAVVLVTSGITESRMPSLAEIREVVSRDFVQSEKRRLFAERGEELRSTIEDSLATQSFSEITSSLGLEVTDSGPFTGASVPQELRTSNIWEQARYLDKGEITPMNLSANEGTFVYMQDKTVPQLDTDSEEYQEFLAQRTASLNQAMGWSRLREITDQGLNALLGTSGLE